MNERDDRELQRHLSGDSDVRRAYRSLPADSPPAALDDAILAAAHEEARRPVRPRWFVPVSVAATILLGVGLTWQQTRLVAPPMHDGPVSDSAPLPQADAGPARGDEALVGRLADPARVATEHDLERLEAAAPREATMSRRESRSDIVQKNADYAPPTPPAAPEVAAERMRQALPAASAPAPVAPAHDAAREAESAALRDALQSRVYVMDAPAMKSEAETAGTAAPAPSTAVAADGTFAQSAPARASSLEEITLAAATVPEGDDEAAERLEEIRELHEKGQRLEAWRRFRIFMKEFPDYEIPEDFPYRRR